jgi:hypothetical protein
MKLNHEMMNAMFFVTWGVFLVLFFGFAVSTCDTPQTTGQAHQQEMEKMKICLDAGKDWKRGSCVSVKSTE